jgi:hypothetical protein
MTNLRRVTLAFVIVGGVMGAFIKFATGNFIARESYVVDFSKLPEKIDQFFNQGERNKDGSLQLRSTQCERSIFMNAYSIKEFPPAALSTLLYPPNEWRTLYVYRGKTYDQFARVPAYFRLVALRSMEAIMMSKRDLSDEYLFSFHIPVECVIDPNSAVAAAETMLRSTAPQPRY